MPRSRGRSGRPYLRARARVLESDICHLCLHPGADQADHHPYPLKTLEALGLDPADPAHMKPAHGVKGCPTCGRKCNQEKGDSLQWTRPRTSRAW